MAQLFSNSASTVLLGSISNVSTTILVTGGTGELFPDFSAPDYCVCTLEDQSGNFEIVKATARTGDSFTVVRGQEGTLAKAFSAGDRFELRLTAALMGSFVQADSGTIDGGTF
jgi:hypothetical protein